MGIFHFPSNFVYWENIENHENIKSVLMKKILELDQEKFKDHMINNATTNYTGSDDITKYLNIDMIKELVWDPLANLLLKIKLTPNYPNIEISEAFIGSSWYTKYDKNGSFRLHNHSSKDHFINGKPFQSTFSMIYILNDENERNTTLFKDLNLSSLSTLRTTEFQFFTGDVEEIKEGTVIIFPSSLYHEVLDVEKPGRITIAFNILCGF